MHNSYHFATEGTLREALRRFRDLEATMAIDSLSATIYLDLKQALGDDPSNPVYVLTKHQRRLVQDYLIENKSIDEVAKKHNITPRVVHYGVTRAIKALKRYFETKEENFGRWGKKSWKPWMIELMRNPYLSVSEIAAKVGKTERAVQCAMERYRHEGIPLRAVRRPSTRGKSE